MKRWLLVGCLMSVVATAQTKEPLVATYSIVAWDSASGEFGAAVQSHYFKVADVIWAEPGVGVVATQSFVDFSYGPIGLAAMRNGKSAQQALNGLLAADSGRSVRQVAMIDRSGQVAAHTGENCIEAAGHRTGRGFSCQANLMRNNTVWDAMAQAFDSTAGALADRMMAALEAAQREGGDIRGMQSAAMLVVSGRPTGQSWKDRLVDLRVDDHPEPVKELRRLLNLNRAYKRVDRGDELVTNGNIEAAEAEYAEAAKLAPGNLEILFWQAVTMVQNNRLDKALPIFKDVFSRDREDAWRPLVPRLVKSGLLPDDQTVLDQIVKQ